MQNLLFILLLTSLSASGQTKQQIRKAVDSAVATAVILECARKDVISARFFVPAVKIGNQFYWRRKLKPIPKTWFVWDYKTMKS